ncbi:major facilitator superfamily domain-containing protein [Cercophora scortea]|uniref:Major facilitator superfamily domain-containing protein n=1 Tax=Cercophora scortea TaxID=314031 RepID=A0AAE0I8X0_9PEZI|nr:major facilitator superfamily domain-containing protein [Cercophora scortea]
MDLEKDDQSTRSTQQGPSRSTSDIEKQQGQSGDSETDAVSEAALDDDQISPCQEQQQSDGTAGASGGLSKIISRVLTKTSTKSNWNPGPPPDGGLKAWTQVACGHLVVMITWGFINSFGVFQTYYVSSLARPPSDISWIGSVQIFLLFFIGTVTGRLTDAGYFRHIFLAGAAFQILGIFTTAVASTSYWQLFLAQGVCIGLGNGCLFCPTMAIVSTYFSKRRALAIGITAAGSATGGLVFPSMMRELLPRVGFAWTLRTIGFIALLCLGLAYFGLEQRIKPRKAGPVVEWAAFRELEYTFYACGSFFCFLGVYFAFYYLSSFSRDVTGLSYTSSLNLLLVLNGVGLPARVIPNHFADRVGPINVFIPTAAAAGILVLCWTAVRTTAGLYVWAVCYGIAAGAIQSLFPAGLTSLTTDLRKAGVRMGMVFTINSFATLTGPPIAGAIISAAGGKYYGAQAFAGSTLIVGAGFMVAARVVKGRKSVDATGWRVRV